ncbi:40S ribosomal protein [Venturia nashicola]|uniref:Mitochondrial pyruvate carrier n=1 Tax=Venturia nashicola TaxID=86259 RepID=A0A4Z1P5I8_9PEZI|nr:40S ribosomal protein [Venturia nashicola]
MPPRVPVRLLRTHQISALRTSFRQQIQQPFRFQRGYAATEAAPVAEETGFAKFWNSKVGPKTLVIVLAGVADFAKPPESLSLNQNLALLSTGAIWTRWCFIIKPQNLFLAAINFGLGIVGAIQVTRITLYNNSLKKGGITETIKDEVKAEGQAIKDTAAAAKKAVN